MTNELEKSYKELLQAYESYIQLLSAELNEIVPLAIAHRWQSSRVEQGEKARELISSINKQINEQQEKINS